MYDELIKQMMACCKGVPCKDANCGFNPKSDLDCIEQLLTKAADAIEDLEKCLAIALLEYQIANNKWLITEEYTKQKLQWIPVTERLPNCNGCYLVWRPHFFGGEIGMPSICYFDGSNTWHDSYGVDFERILHPKDVTHWMPLPQPPESEET